MYVGKMLLFNLGVMNDCSILNNTCIIYLNFTLNYQKWISPLIYWSLTIKTSFGYRDILVNTFDMDAVDTILCYGSKKYGCCMYFQILQ